ncbi:hypothetical protein GIB67_023451 [Kingdonia uniflora]|uniref:Uncharacterized protein n=1 Tax=Kingdonia uniflora TaxID=39325 RepID=A0A7J7P9Z2_9MAGN|nr:hypothetical protein GIB67_023451 [Kingdonia uniflora]
MGSERRSNWSVYDGVKTIPSTPEALMAEINSAITTLEYSNATSLLQYPPSTSPSPSSSSSKTKSSPKPDYDARLADEAYKAGCAAIAANKLDSALQSLQISLSKCPPERTSAVAKLQSLITITSQQLQSPNS